MSVNPGFGGQPFIERTLLKLREARAMIDSTQSADASSKSTAASARRTSSARSKPARDVLVAGSSVFGAADPAGAVQALQSARRSGVFGSGPLTEDALIAALREVARERRLRRASRVGIGDDAAVWQPSRSAESVITTDALVEGVHFTPRCDERARRRRARAGLEPQRRRRDGSPAGARDGRARHRARHRRRLDPRMLSPGSPRSRTARPPRSSAATSMRAPAI